MLKTRIFTITCLLFSTFFAPAASARNVVVGVNVVAVDQMSDAQQDAFIGELQKYGVKTIRTALGGKNDRYTAFVVKAFKGGIGSIVMVSPNAGGKGLHTAKANPSAGRGWAMPALSDADPEGFEKWFGPEIAALENAGVRITAFELGNEINMTWDNADFPVPNSGRVLGLSDLNNPNDAEARSVAAGYRVYVKIMAALKEMRDRSRLNQKAPIISGGLGNVGLPKAQSFNKQLQVAIPDTIAFLRQNGIDAFLDGYGVHVYPNGNTHQPMPERIADLDGNVFAGCRQGEKPCWLTEWGFDNNAKSCPIDDSVRIRQLTAQRNAFKGFVDGKRMVASVYYSWSGMPNEKQNSLAIFRCGALTEAGRLALSPM
jgi:hypothetical protein